MAPVEVRPTPPPGFVLDTPGYAPTPPPGFILDTETAAEKVLGGEIGQVIGREKGLGYFGPLKRPDRAISTELSIGVTGPEYGNKETEIPLLVPTLAREEIDYLLAGNKPTKSIIRKAEEYARIRISKGLSPFAQKGEQGKLPEGKPGLGYIVGETLKGVGGQFEEAARSVVSPIAGIGARLYGRGN